MDTRWTKKSRPSSPPNTEPVLNTAEAVSHTDDVGSSSIEPEPRTSRSEPVTRNRSARSESASAGSVSNADKLLELRKTYHRLSHQLTQASHHKQLIENCLEENLIPEGLWINLEPQAFMSSKTNIKDEWNKKLIAMSKSFLLTLADHYWQLSLD